MGSTQKIVQHCRACFSKVVDLCDYPNKIRTHFYRSGRKVVPERSKIFHHLVTIIGLGHDKKMRTSNIADLFPTQGAFCLKSIKLFCKLMRALIIGPSTIYTYGNESKNLYIYVSVNIFKKSHIEETFSLS